MSLKCVTCDTAILPATAERTRGLCMPCAKGTRYRHIGYLSVEEFFAKATDDYCLAPNLEPHPSNAEFAHELVRLRQSPGVVECLIPVAEYQDPEHSQDPYSDRVFVAGSFSDNSINEWAERLRGECYREEHPGAEIPREYSRGNAGWFLVWD